MWALWEVRGRRPNREGVQAASGSGAGECGVWMGSEAAGGITSLSPKLFHTVIKRL